jgi:FecCD transport family/Cobalamin-5-phosphate synthase
MRRSLSSVLVVCTVLLIVAITAGVAAGSVGLSPGAVWQVVFDHLTGHPRATIADAIVWQLRLPRVLLAAVVGAALTTAGGVVQVLVRNALADPFLLGVSSGASVGATTVLLFGALIGWALLLFSTLESLTAMQLLRALIAACAAGRLAALLHAAEAPPARQDGLGAELRITHAALVTGAVIAVVILVAAVGPARGAVSAGVCGLVSATSALLARRTIGGRTGDTIGAAVAITEVAVCLTLLGTWR